MVDFVEHLIGFFFYIAGFFNVDDNFIYTSVALPSKVSWEEWCGTFSSSTEEFTTTNCSTWIWGQGTNPEQALG